jgi:hypothetical protein
LTSIKACIVLAEGSSEPALWDVLQAPPKSFFMAAGGFRGADGGLIRINGLPRAATV